MTAALAWVRGAKPSLRTRLALAFALLLVEALRRAPDFLSAQFFAEDGPLFYAAAGELGFWRPLLTPTEGYLNTFPRLAGALAHLLPLGAAPLLFAILVLLLRLAPVAYLLSDRAATLVPSFPGRLAVATLYVLLPNVEEVCSGITNAQWLLTPTALLIVLCSPPAGVLGWVADLSLLSLFALTGPMSLVMAPVALLLLRKTPPGVGRTRLRAIGGVLLAGAAVQAICLSMRAPTNRLGHASLSTLGAGNLVRILSGHVVYDNLFGWRHFKVWQASFGVPAHLAGVALLALLVVVVVRRRDAPLLLLLYLAAATVSLSLAFPSNDLALWVDAGFSQRYYLTASLFAVLAALRLACSPGSLRWVGVACTASTVLVAVPGDYLSSEQFDTRFADQLAVFRSLPPRAEFALPIFPEGWGMKLRRAPDAVPLANPFAALPQSPRAPAVTMNGIWFAQPLGLSDGRYAQISGWASDPGTGKRAGGVFILAGDRMFPAVYGRRRAIPSAEIQVTYDTLFFAFVPEPVVRANAGRLFVAVMSSDRTSFLRPFGPLYPPL